MLLLHQGQLKSFSKWPLCFFLLFAVIQSVLNGKSLFGSIYGIAVAGSIGLWVLFNGMSIGNSNTGTQSSVADSYYGSVQAKSFSNAMASPIAQHQQLQLQQQQQQPIGMWNICSILGYCMLPVVLASVLAWAVSRRGAMLHFLLGMLGVSWAAHSASKLVMASCGGSGGGSGSESRGQRILVAYPLGLFYSCFLLMGL